MVSGGLERRFHPSCRVPSGYVVSDVWDLEALGGLLLSDTVGEDTPQVAAVFEHKHHEAPHPPCRQGLGVPVLTLTSGSDEPLVRSDGEARMGLDRPSEETLATIDWAHPELVVRVGRRIRREVVSLGQFGTIRCHCSGAVRTTASSSLASRWVVTAMSSRSSSLRWTGTAVRATPRC